MKGPPIYVVVRRHGDGYGHNSSDYVSWHFDESEAETNATVLKSASNDYTWYTVETVPAGDPMPKKERW